jgi:SAM-dependent methyltransferase
MRDGEFEHINACQDWANWRTLPRLIRSIPVPGPWTVIDLGCGQGLSTEVLAWCCPPGSSLLGYDLSESALRVARQRVYRHPNGITENVRFVTQAIDQPWKSPDGSVIGDASTTLINACGVVGHHLSESRFERVAAEIRRVLAPNGWALLDSGPKLGRQSLSRIMEANGLAHRSRVASWWFDRYGQSAFSFGAH